MASVKGPDEQIRRAHELQDRNSTWSAAAYLRNRGFTLTQALWFLLGIRSERRLVPVVATGSHIESDQVCATRPGLEIIYWPDEPGYQGPKQSYS